MRSGRAEGDIGRGGGDTGLEIAAVMVWKSGAGLGLTVRDRDGLTGICLRSGVGGREGGCLDKVEVE